MQSLRITRRCATAGAAPAKPCVARVPSVRPRQVVMAAQAQAAKTAPFAPPTVSQTKEKFLKLYSRPLASIYSVVVQELLVQQHFMRFNKNYLYNEIFALGFVSVFEQVLESIPEPERKEIFNAYIQSLSEDPEQYRRDAAKLEEQAAALSSSDGLTPSPTGTDLQKTLDRVAQASASGNFSYNKFFAIGLFRLLELTGAKEPAALERLVKAVNVKQDSVNRDLMLYKGILSKLSASKELMREFLEREKRKQGERDAAKAAKAAAPVQA